MEDHIYCVASCPFACPSVKRDVEMSTIKIIGVAKPWSIFVRCFFITEPEPWTVSWSKHVLQKVVCLLRVYARYTQTDRQTDRQTEMRSQLYIAERLLRNVIARLRLCVSEAERRTTWEVYNGR